MSGLNNLHITVPQPGHYNNYTQRDRSSLSSVGSSNSMSPMPSPMTPISPQNMNWDCKDMPEDCQRRPSKRGVSTFISKLFSMVSDMRNQHLISWNPSGSSFLVCNATRFAQEVLPEHFKHSNFSSFVRQLNMYGFHKINKSPRGQRGNNENEIWEFSHPKFQRGRPDLLEDIKRKAMDSELLRRETGDIHASFAMVQLSQADLLQQFRVLQENFSNLLQGFDEMKKVQLQQQMIIRRLSERQGLPPTPLNEFEHNGQPSVFVTTPTSAGGEHMQQWSPHTHTHPHQPAQQRMHPDMMIPSMYQNNSNDNGFPFHIPMSNPLPPSPVSSVLLSSPSSSCADEPNPSNNHRMSNPGMSLNC